MKQLTLILACLLGLGMTGCGSGAPAPQPPAPVPAPPLSSPQADILLGRGPAGATAWAEAMKHQSGVFRQNLGDWDVYMISMGEQLTGGFGVELVQADVGKGKAVVDVRYTRPGPGDIVAQVLTYPYYLFAVPAGTETTARLVGEGPSPQVLELQGP